MSRAASSDDGSSRRAFACLGRNQGDTKDRLCSSNIAPCVTVRPTDVAGALGQRAPPIHGLQQFGSSFTNDEPSVELDPVLATKRQGPYARSNRLTATLRRRTIRRSHQMSVAARSPERRHSRSEAFVRASSLHVGAAAAAAALRRDLVDKGRLSASAFDEAYAVARVTPGTNLLAMYTLLGERFAGWRGALIGAHGRCARSRAHRRGAGCRVRRLRWAPARRRGHAGRTCWRAGRVRMGDRETRPTAAPAAPASRRCTGGHHVGHDVLVPIPQFVILLVAGGLGAAFLRTDP